MGERGSSAATLEQKAKAYVEQAAGRPLLDDNGEPVRNKGVPVMQGAYPLTMAGLACALGMTRDELREYPAEGAKGKVIQWAKAQVEAYAEAALFESGMATGAKFALSHNFDGWDENPKPAKQPWELTDEELDKRIHELEKKGD